MIRGNVQDSSLSEVSVEGETPDLETKEGRKRMQRQIVQSVDRRRVAPALVRELGLPAGTLLAHLFRWDSKSKKDPHGWFYQSKTQIQDLTGMGERSQRTARKKLVEAGYLEEEMRKGIPPRLWFRPNLFKILELVNPEVAAEIRDLEAMYESPSAEEPESPAQPMEDVDGWIRGEEEPETEAPDAEPTTDPDPEWTPFEEGHPNGDAYDADIGFAYDADNGDACDADKQRVTTENDSIDLPFKGEFAAEAAPHTANSEAEKNESTAHGKTTSPPVDDGDPDLLAIRGMLTNPEGEVRRAIDDGDFSGLLEAVARSRLEAMGLPYMPGFGRTYEAMVVKALREPVDGKVRSTAHKR